MPESLGLRKLVYCLAYNGDVVAFKMGRRQGGRRAHPVPEIAYILLRSKWAVGKARGVEHI